MAILVIAGHGRQKNGSFDPGAIGYISEGEHRYMANTLFPAMKRHLPKGARVVFYSATKVNSYGNLLQLVRQHNAKSVVEFHYDAHTMGSSARGGHVIVHSNRSPNKLDLAIRDAINSMVGVRYTHKGQSGISGRNNLFNVNLASQNRIDYRLVELGFGTNRTDADIMTKKVDEYAKKLVEAITGSSSSSPSKSKTNTSSGSNTSSTPTIKIGSKGAAVKKAQQSLISKGYNVGRAGADSIFGKDTDTATKQLQKDAGIGVDGIIGKDTWRILNSNFKKPTATPKPVTSTPIIRKGSKGNSVKKAQQSLVSKGYSVGRAGADGDFGNDTDKAVRQLQRDAKIKVDGIVGADTWRVLNSNFKKPSTAKKSTGGFKVGQKVTLKRSASSYATGERIPPKFKNKRYTVQQVGNGRVLLKELVSWVRNRDIK